MFLRRFYEYHNQKSPDYIFQLIAFKESPYTTISTGNILFFQVNCSLFFSKISFFHLLDPNLTYSKSYKSFQKMFYILNVLLQIVYFIVTIHSNPYLQTLIIPGRNEIYWSKSSKTKWFIFGINFLFWQCSIKSRNQYTHS